ncbi:MAG: ArsR/SmtB family transcription factor [Candidatus Acidiferrales bacterium]
MVIKEMVKISKALGDPTRLRIFEAIAAEKEMSCQKLLGLESLTPATISHHLKVLSEAGLIESRREGQFMHIRANPETMRHYTHSLARLSRHKQTSKR